MVTIIICNSLYSHGGYHMITSSRDYLHGNSIVDKSIIAIFISDIINIDVNEVNRYSIRLSWTNILYM